MTDVLTKTQRSFNMSMIRAENTSPEIKFLNLLHSGGIEDFYTHPKEIIGKPDFYFPHQKLAVFIDGCFWHGCKKCFRKPQTNKKFWVEKITKNIKRDREVKKMLSRCGIKTIRFWEHEIKDLEAEYFTKLISNKKGVKNKKTKIRLNALDLFAGAGGLSEGFYTAGFDIVGYIEMNKDACETIKTRIIYHSLKKRGKIDDYKKYLTGGVTKEKIIDKYNLYKKFSTVINTEINSHNYKKLIKSVKKSLNGKSLDIIIGGPPCQAYSYIGRARDKNKMEGDQRNYLYKHYIEFLKALRPKLFIFENVPGLLTAGNGRHIKNIQQLARKIGYVVEYKLINAADFGVPQSRKRIIIIGWDKKLGLKKYPDFQKVERLYSVKEFLANLPKIKSGAGIQNKRYKVKSAVLEKLGIVDKELNLLTDHISRHNSQRDLEIYKLAALLKKNGKYLKYNKLPKRLKTHKNQKGFLDRYKVVDNTSQNSHTIVAHIAKDGNHYIHPDINQNRSLTVREAARLQTFPDSFKFEGSRTSQFKQIGNAVPPFMALHIARKIKKILL